MRKTALAAAMASTILAVPAFAGVVYEMEVTVPSGGAATTKTRLATDGENLKMSMAQPPGGNGPAEVIYRAGKGDMVTIDHESKTYMVMDPEKLASMTGELSSAMSQIEKALENVPEEQRAMVEKMMKQRLPKEAQQAAASPMSIEVEATGEKKTINGYACTKYVVRSGDQLSRELWVTDWRNVEGGDQAASAFKGMAALMSRMMEALPKGGLFGVSANTGRDMMASLEKIDGFPVSTRELDANGNVTQESTLVSAQQQALGPEEFEPPAGYQSQQIPTG